MATINVKYINKGLPAIVSGETASKIAKKVKSIDSSVFNKKGTIEIDMTDISYMSTQCAKDSFGKAYVDMGPQRFSQKIKFVNLDEAVEHTIRKGILEALE